MPVKFFTEKRKRWLLGLQLEPFEAAAALVQLAADGERAITKPFECTRERDCYSIRRKYQPEIRLAAWTMLLLQFFERPRWTYTRDDWDLREYYPTSGLPHISESVVLPLYLLLLCVIGWAIALEAGYEIFGMAGGVHDVPGAYRLFRLPMKDRRGRKVPFAMFFVTTFVWLISVGQVIVALICEIGQFAHRPFWLAPTLTLFIVLVERSSSRRHSYMLRTIPTFLGMLLILGIAVILFTTMGFLIFSDSSDLYFKTFGDGLWFMFMILIGSDWPGPIIPSIEYNRGFFLFFFAFICLIDWGFLNLITGYIFSNMTTQRERSERLSQLDFKMNMIQAFALLDADTNRAVSVPLIEKVLQEITLRYVNWGRFLIFSALASLFKYMRDFFSEDEQLSQQNRTAGCHRASFTSARNHSQSRENRLSSSVQRISVSILGSHAMMTRDVEDKELKALLNNLFEPAEFDVATGNIISSAKDDLDVYDRDVDLVLFLKFPERCFGKNAVKLVKHKRLEALLTESSAKQTSDTCCGRSYHRFLLYADTKYFDAFVDILLAICSIFVLGYGATVGVVYFMLIVMVLEFTLRYLSKGRRRFTQSYRNLVDAGVTVVLVIMLLAEAIHAEELDPQNRFIRGLMLFRLTLIARNLTLFDAFEQRRKKFKIALKYCAQGAEDILYLLLIMFCVMVAFCEFGVLVFGGAIQKNGSNGEQIAQSEYGEKDYWTLNFNDFASGLGVLFTALHVNNVHVTSSGFEATMETYRPRVFFIAWHCAAVILLLNVIPAFLLNNFWKYYMDSRSKAEELFAEPKKEVDSAPKIATADIATAAEKEITTEQYSFGRTMDRLTELARPTGRARVYSEDFGKLVVSSSPFGAAASTLPPSDLASVPDAFSDEALMLSHSSRRPSIVAQWASQTWKDEDTKEGELTASCQTPSKEPSLAVVREDDYTKNAATGVDNRVNAATGADNRVKSDEIALKSKESSLWSSVVNLFSNEKSDLKEKLLDDHEAKNTSSKFPNFSLLSGITGLMTLGDHVVDRALLAAILVQHAKEGIRPVLFSSRTASLCYIRRMRMSSFFRLVSRVLLMLTCFVRPYWTYVDGFEDWKNDDKYPKTSYLFDDVVGPLVCMFFLLILLYGLSLEFVYSLEAEKVTESTQVALCVAAAEGAVDEAAVPLPLTYDDGKDLGAPGDRPSFSQFRWFNVSGSVSNRQSDVSGVTGLTSMWRHSTIKRDSDAHTDNGNRANSKWRAPSSNRQSSMTSTRAGAVSIDSQSVIRETNYTLRHAESYQQNGFVGQITGYWAYAVACFRQQWFWRIVVTLLVMEEIGHAIYAASTRTHNNPCFAVMACVMWFDNYALRKFRMMLSISKRFIQMLMLFTMMVISLAVFTTLIYQERDNTEAEEMYFGSFQDSLWTIFLIITSTGFPDQILPSYQESRDSILFFIIVVTLGAFLFLNLILLVVNSEFESGKNVREAIEKNFRSLNLQLAFEILDTTNRGYLEYSDIESLLSHLYHNFSEFRKRGVPSAKMQRILVSVMDVNSNHKITMREFNMILDITRIKLKVSNSFNHLEMCFPGITETSKFQSLKEIVVNRYFSLAVDIGLLVCMSLELAAGKDIYAIKRKSSLASLGAMCTLLLLEFLLKLTVFGKTYFHKFDRKMESFLCVTSSIAMVVTYLVSYENVTFGVVLVRVLGLVRLCFGLRNIDLFFPTLGFKNISRIFLRVCKNLGSLAVSLVVIMMLFATLGIYIFGGLINRDPDRDEFLRIEDSRFGESGYWPLNFNDVLSSLMTLVCLLHISDWDVITEGFTAAQENKYPRIFFTAWYCVGVLLLLNTVKSFFMRGFFVNYQTYLSTNSGKSDDANTYAESLAAAAKNAEHKRQAPDIELHSTVTDAGGRESTLSSCKSIEEPDEFSASLGTLKFLPVEDRLFLQARVDSVLKEGRKYEEW